MTVRPRESKIGAAERYTVRIPTEGKVATISVELSAKPNEADILHALENYSSVPQQRALPSAPKRPVIYMTEQDRPQPRKDVNSGHGMAAVVGRVRECPLLDLKLTLLSHNLVRGAAGAGGYCAGHRSIAVLEKGARRREKEQNLR